MADPVAATITQLKNIQARTGKTVAELHAAIAATGATKHSERRSWLMEQFKLGYGDANTVVHFIGKPLPDLEGNAGTTAALAADGDPLAAIYSGAKAGLRPLHDAVMAKIRAFGAFDEAPKKDYISLRRKKQFAMIGPATNTRFEVGLNMKGVPGTERLLEQPAGGMCSHKVRVADASEVDAELAGWLRQAFDSAG